MFLNLSVKRRAVQAHQKEERASDIGERSDALVNSFRENRNVELNPWLSREWAYYRWPEGGNLRSKNSAVAR